MYRVVEINQPVVKPPPVVNPKPQKTKLTEEKVLEIIIILKRQIRYLPKAQKRYRRIGNKHNVDLATWVKEQKDLPKDDDGRQICLFIERAQKAPKKLEFYKKLLDDIRKEKKKEVTKEETEQ